MVHGQTLPGVLVERRAALHEAIENQAPPPRGEVARGACR